MYCTNCNEACESMTVDRGLGADHAFGISINDSQIRAVSKCCDADLIDEQIQDYSDLRYSVLEAPKGSVMITHRDLVGHADYSDSAVYAMERLYPKLTDCGFFEDAIIKLEDYCEKMIETKSMTVFVWRE